MNGSKVEERRRFHRVLYHADANLSDLSNTIPCKVVDLSLKGCLLEFEQLPLATPREEEKFMLTISLSESVDIKMALTACHIFSNRIGFKCEKIDIDSISALRRLVELNLGDSEQLERDLHALY